MAPGDPVNKAKVAEIVARYRPRGWAVVQRKLRKGKTEAYAEDRRGSGSRPVIRVPVLRDLYTLGLFLHEVGHVARGHLTHGSDLSPHVQEAEAELYAWYVLHAEGFRPNALYKREMRRYIRKWVEADERKGVVIQSWVRKWTK